MAARSIVLKTSLLITTISLCIGYLLNGFWLIVPALLASWILYFMIKSVSPFWSASILFLVNFFFFANGILLNLPISLMIAGCSAALISWDLLNFNNDIKSNLALSVDPILELHHMKSMGLALGTGTLLTVVASQANFQFTFSSIVVIAFITSASLVFGIKTLSN